jgi:hypothetical protein
LRIIAILLAVYAAIIAQQPEGTPVEAVRREDVYAIYSALMTNPPSRARTASTVYLIAINTVSGSTLSGNPPQPCTRLLPEYADKWNEILTDYQARKGKPDVLEPLLKLAKPSVLLTDGEAREFRAGLDPMYQNPRNPRFQNAQEMYSLGTVYFDRSHTLALTAVSSYCGSLCGMSGWRVFEKTFAGQWQLVTRRAGPTACGDAIA